jgi:hypothetical protein
MPKKTLFGWPAGEGPLERRAMNPARKCPSEAQMAGEPLLLGWNPCSQNRHSLSMILRKDEAGGPVRAAHLHFMAENGGNFWWKLKIPAGSDFRIDSAASTACESLSRVLDSAGVSAIIFGRAFWGNTRFRQPGVADRIMIGGRVQSWFQNFALSSKNSDTFPRTS